MDNKTVLTGINTTHGVMKGHAYKPSCESRVVIEMIARHVIDCKKLLQCLPRYMRQCGEEDRCAKDDTDDSHGRNIQFD